MHSPDEPSSRLEEVSSGLDSLLLRLWPEAPDRWVELVEKRGRSEPDEVVAVLADEGTGAWEKGMKINPTK